MISLFIFPLLASALSLSESDSSSICDNGAQIVNGVLDYYEGLEYGGTVGMFTEPYYWWQAGEAFGSLLDYNYYCPGNDTLQDLIHTGITTQLGDNYDLMVSNFSSSEGNDDQGVWSLTIMSAAEKNFPAPNDKISWSQIAVNTFNTMFNRWDDYCQGGIRWQIFQKNNNGYTYKNTISNGALFTLAARLGKYYNDSRYLYIADFIWEWVNNVGFIIENDTDMTVYDGGNIQNNCQDVGKEHWSYNYGIFLMGSAYLYNQTNDSVWLNRAEKLLNSSINLFFNDDKILYESQCQLSNKITCNNDQRSFKAIFIRCLATTSYLIPQLADTIAPYIESSAKAAAESCSGGSDNITCGLDWTQSKWDGLYGLGEEISALETIQSLLVENTKLNTL